MLTRGGIQEPWPLSVHLLPWIRQDRDWFRLLLDQKRDYASLSPAQKVCPFPPCPEWQLCLWEQIPQSPNVINQTNRVYGSGRELLNPAWQLINELIRWCGESGRECLPSCELPGRPGPSLDPVPFLQQEEDPRGRWDRGASFQTSQTVI